MFLESLIRLLTLQDAPTRTALIGTAALGLAGGVVGTLAVLRKRSLVGDAVAHASLPGICAAFLLTGERHFAALLLGALVFGVLAAWTISVVRTLTRTKEDAAIGMAIGGFFGLGLVLSRIIQNQPGGNRAGLDSFIFGKAASMVRSDAMLIAAAAGAVVAVVVVLFKELKLLCFDREFAAAQGLPVSTLDLLVMALVCVCTVVGLPAVGIVLMVALLVIPPVAARCWTDRFGRVTALAGCIGLVSGALGTALSATLPSPAELGLVSAGEGSLSRGWPTGPLIVLVAAGCFFVSLVAAPKRGIAAAIVRRTMLRRRVAMDHLLRAVYEHLEPTNDITRAWTTRDLAVGLGGAMARARRSGLIVHQNGSWKLTPRGAQAATAATKRHRLWELFLIEQAEIAPDHVHRDADALEHVLEPAMVARLEERLRQTGRLPMAVPDSPHPIPADRVGTTDPAGGRR